MAQEPEEIVDEIEEETPQPGEGLKSLLQKIAERDQPADEVVEETAAIEEPVEEEVKKPETPTGPSLAMKAFAKQQGLPPEVIAIAANDEHLNSLVEFAAAQNQTKVPEKTEPIEEEKPFTLELPEDEFPADDSVRKVLEGLNAHYEKKNSQVMDYLSQMADVLVRLDQSQKAGIEQQHASVQHAFDSYLDSYEDEVLGQYESLSDVGMKLRNAVYTHYLDLKNTNPKTPETELMERAVKSFGYSKNQAKKMEAIQADNSRRLGGRPSPLKGEVQKTSFAARLAEINNRPHNKVT